MWRKGKRKPRNSAPRDIGPPRTGRSLRSDPPAAALPSSDVDFQLHLETETVEHCHPSKPLCAQASDSVRSVLRMLQAEKTGAAMICTDGRLNGGFTTMTPPRPGGPLVILYAVDLVDAQARVEAAGGRIAKPIFDFPGGQRFHFLDPDGYELAVWTKR